MSKFFVSEVLLKNSYIMIFHHNGVLGSEIHDLQELIRLKNSEFLWSVYTKINSKNKYFSKRAGLNKLKAFFIGPTLFFAVNDEKIFLEIIKELPQFQTLLPTIIYYKNQYIEAQDFYNILKNDYTVENKIYPLLYKNQKAIIQNLQSSYFQFVNLLIFHKSIMK